MDYERIQGRRLWRVAVAVSIAVLLVAILAERAALGVGKLMFGQTQTSNKLRRVLPNGRGVRVYRERGGTHAASARVWEGESLTLLSDHGEWLKTTRGWVKLRDVVDMESAERHFSELIEMNPTAFAYASRARTRIERAQFEAGLADAERSIELDPGYAPGWFNRGSIRAFKEDIRGAIDDFSTAARLDPAFGPALRNRGRANALLRRYDAAVRDYDSAIAVGFHDSQAFAERGTCHARRRRFAAAIEDFDRAIAADSSDPVVYVNRGVAFLESHSYENALSNFNEAIARDHASWFAYDNRANLFKMRGDNGRALADADAAIALKTGRAVPLTTRSEIWLAMGKPEKAILDAEEAVRLQPDWAPAWNSRGVARGHAGDYLAALDDFSRAISLDASFGTAFRNRGNAFSMRGEYAKALRDLEAAAQIDPDEPDALFSLAWLLATCAQATVRDGPNALIFAKRACELIPIAGADGLRVRAAAHAECGDFESAIFDVECAIKLCADNNSRRRRLEADRALYRRSQPLRGAPRTSSRTL